MNEVQVCARARVYECPRAREAGENKKIKRLVTMLLLMWRSNLYQTDDLIAFITLDIQQQSVDCSS